jgi:hypothetical protein
MLVSSPHNIAFNQYDVNDKNNNNYNTSTNNNNDNDY